MERSRLSREKKCLFLLIGVSALIRCVLASVVEFGNDEVYYWTYAKSPDWSHFDHPPMVGYVVQLFTLNLLFDSVFAIRLAAIVMMSVNTYVAFLVGRQIKDERNGLWSAILFTSSVYVFILTGTFVLPDTPLAFFWLLSLLMLVKYFKGNERQPKHLLLAGLFIGLSMLSKYSGVFLWVGVGLYILLFNRSELKNKWLYVSVLISFVCFLPVLVWNMGNQFVSFTFHTERVGYQGIVNPVGFVRELVLELVYNNPVLAVLGFVAAVMFMRRKDFMETETGRLLLCISLPLLLLFWMFSFIRPVLPHWNAPSYMTLIFMVPPMLAQKSAKHLRGYGMASLATLLVVVAFGFAEIRYGVIDLSAKTGDEKHLGKDDFTLEMYGWKDVLPEFERIRNEKIAEGMMKPTDGIVGYRWFPTAHFDYYVARPLNLKTYCVGGLDMSHKYLWTNDLNGGMRLGDDFWFLTDSPQYISPDETVSPLFEETVAVDTIEVHRNGTKVKNVYVFTMKNLRTNVVKLSDYIGK